MTAEYENEQLRLVTARAEQAERERDRMLAALKATADELEDADPARRAAIDFAREIIAKAEGRGSPQ